MAGIYSVLAPASARSGVRVAAASGSLRSAAPPWRLVHSGDSYSGLIHTPHSSGGGISSNVNITSDYIPSLLLSSSSTHDLRYRKLYDILTILTYNYLPFEQQLTAIFPNLRCFSSTIIIKFDRRVGSPL